MTRQPEKLLDKCAPALPVPRVPSTRWERSRGKLAAEMQFGSRAVAGQRKHQAYSPEKTYAYRHSIAAHILENQYDGGCTASAGTVQELLGHKDVKTWMVYTHVLNWGGLAVRNPLD